MNHPQTLLQQYLELLNRAIERNMSSKTDDVFMAATTRALTGRQVGVSIYDGEPPQLLTACTVRINDGKAHLVALQHPDSDTTLPLSLSFLEDVVTHPEQYLPNRICREWDALASRTDPGTGLQ
jgi:hypothetical protein